MESKIVPCKFCTNIIPRENLVIIDKTSQEYSLVLSSIHLGHTEKFGICKFCFIKLIATFEFKSKCLDINRQIESHINFELTEVDLREVILEKKSVAQLSIDIPAYKKICRLCLKIADNNEYKMVSEVDSHWIQTCIPEVNFNLSRDPSICRECLVSLEIHNNFIQTCVNQEKDSANSNIESNVHMPSLDMCIKEEIIEIKSEAIEDNLVDDFRSEEEMEPDKSSKERQPDFTSEHLDPLQLTMYKCDLCPYESRFKKYLTKHRLTHKDDSEVTRHKCNFCSFQTRDKSYLNKHQRLHKDESEIIMHKCTACPYQSKWKSVTKTHQLTHKNESEVRMYDCTFCSFKTKHKHSLKVHELVHKDKSELIMYKCEACCYQTKYKSHLKVHQDTHNTGPEVKVHKCEFCSFRTKDKRYLKKHQNSHGDA